MSSSSCEAGQRDRLRIVVGEDERTETLYTDRVALASMSPVFSAMMRAPLSEQRTNTIIIEDADTRSFEVLLDMCGVLTSPGQARINSVYTAVGLLRKV